MSSRDTDYRAVWSRSRGRLNAALTSLGFPEALGNAIAGHLGSPKAIDRMTVYLENVQPQSVELVVDLNTAISLFNQVLYPNIGVTRLSNSAIMPPPIKRLAFGQKFLLHVSIRAIASPFLIVSPLLSVLTLPTSLVAIPYPKHEKHNNSRRPKFIA